MSEGRSGLGDSASVRFRGLVADRADRAFVGGAVHEDDETAKPRHILVDHVGHVILLAAISVYELGLQIEGSQVLNKRLAGGIAPTGGRTLPVA